MSRWKIKVQDDAGRARIVICDGPNTIGVMTMSWGDYLGAVRSLLGIVRSNSYETIARCLGQLIWQDAQSVGPLSELSAENAAERLAELGWTNEKVNMFAAQLSKELTQELAGLLPEHVG